MFHLCFKSAEYHTGTITEEFRRGLFPRADAKTETRVIIQQLHSCCVNMFNVCKVNVKSPMPALRGSTHSQLQGIHRVNMINTVIGSMWDMS